MCGSPSCVIRSSPDFDHIPTHTHRTHAKSCVPVDPPEQHADGAPLREAAVEEGEGPSLEAVGQCFDQRGPGPGPCLGLGGGFGLCVCMFLLVCCGGGKETV